MVMIMVMGTVMGMGMDTLMIITRRGMGSISPVRP